MKAVISDICNYINVSINNVELKIMCILTGLNTLSPLATICNTLQNCRKKTGANTKDDWR